MYITLLAFHNILRWLVLLAALIAIGRAVSGWVGSKRAWSRSDDRAGLAYTVLLDIQVLLGFLLYFVYSPLTTTGLRDFGGAMGNAPVRYFLVEHSLLMLVAAVMAHIGRAAAKRGQGAARFRRVAVWFILSFLLILISIPWPFLSAGRPLLRGLGF